MAGLGSRFVDLNVGSYPRLYRAPFRRTLLTQNLVLLFTSNTKNNDIIPERIKQGANYYYVQSQGSKISHISKALVIR
jgi:hypothetical protein